MTAIQVLSCRHVPLSRQALGMTKPPAAKQLFLRRMLRRVEARGEDALGVARVDRELGDPNWHLLRRLTALDPGAGLSRIVSRLSASTLSIPSAGAPCQPDAGFFILCMAGVMIILYGRGVALPWHRGRCFAH